MKIALVHDYLIRFGGAERVLLNLRKIFPQADVFTLLYDKEKMGQHFKDVKVNTSFLQKFPEFWRKRQKYLLPFIPAAPETFDLRDYDLVISSSSSFAKGVITRPRAVHICYCHSPMRFAWDSYSSYVKQQKKGKLTNLGIRVIMHYIRMWDKSAASRVDYFIANSKTTAGRINKFYGSDAKVIYPPVVLDGFEKLNQVNRGYFLCVPSSLTPYKKVDLAVKAFNKLGLPLVIIGEGPEKKRLKRMANDNIEFLGWQSDAIVREYFRNCTAFLFPGEDDFGIAPVEAMGFGKPVLAFRKGGATEIVLEGITGEFFDDSVSESLAEGVRRILINYENYSPLLIRKRAEKFSQDRFEKSIKEFVIEVLEKRKLRQNS